MVYVAGEIMSKYCTNCRYLEKRSIGNDSYWKCCMPNAMVPKLNLLQRNPLRSTFCVEGGWYEVKVKQQEKEMTTEEMIKVMQAYVDGEQIQVFNHISQEWNGITNPKWQWDIYKYRIKPEPKYRPLKPEELIELKGKWLRPNGVRKNEHILVTEILSNSIKMSGCDYDTETLLLHFTYEDGTPVGKLEE